MKESIIISLSLQRHGSLLFSDSLSSVSVTVQVVQEGLHEDPLDNTQPVRKLTLKKKVQS